jgi:hypothetical protein
MHAGQPLTDLEERWWGGRATGETFKTFFALANADPALAFWEHAVTIVKLTAKSFNVKGARTKLLQARDRFLPVAHLWAARSIREGQFVQHPEVGYDATADFQSFLTEAEILRQWGQTWRPPRKTSEPPLPQEEIISLLATGTTREELTGNNNVLAGRAAMLLVGQLYRKVFKKGQGTQSSSVFDRLDLDVGTVDPRTGQQQATARFKINDQFVVLGDLGVGGDYRGMLKYLIRFK